MILTIPVIVLSVEDAVNKIKFIFDQNLKTWPGLDREIKTENKPDVKYLAFKKKLKIMTGGKEIIIYIQTCPRTHHHLSPPLSEISFNCTYFKFVYIHLIC